MLQVRQQNEKKKEKLQNEYKEQKHYLSLFQRHSIIALAAAEFSVDSIADMINCNVRTVSRWLYRAIEHIGLEHQPRCGRDEILSEEEKTLIVARAAEDPFVTPGMIKFELDLSCSYRTIDRVLIQAGLYGRVALKSYPYTDSQKQVRLCFSSYVLLDYKDLLDASFLSTIFFTDESSLQLGLHGNRVYVRRPKGDQYKLMAEYMWEDHSKVKSGKIKFFAGFCLAGVSQPYFYEKMTGATMIDIIKTNIVPETQRLFHGRPWVILHDNDKKWRNKVYMNMHLVKVFNKLMMASGLPIPLISIR